MTRIEYENYIARQVTIDELQLAMICADFNWYNRKLRALVRKLYGDKNV